MPNQIRNGDFEEGLRDWEYPDGIVAVRRCPEGTPTTSRGDSLYVELGQWFSIEQRYPWTIYAEASHLYFHYRGYAASFYVNVHYDDGSMDDVYIYGHWPSAWQRGSVPVRADRGIVRLEFLVQIAFDFYLDDISLEGRSYPSWPREPNIRQIPEQFPEPWMLIPRIEDRLIGIEQALNRISSQMAQDRYPDLEQKIKEERGRRESPPGRPRKK